jgi:hypothetical protein
VTVAGVGGGVCAVAIEGGGASAWVSDVVGGIVDDGGVEGAALTTAVTLGVGLVIAWRCGR